MHCVKNNNAVITEPPVEQTVCPSSKAKATFYCEACNTPSVDWYINGYSIRNNVSHFQSNGVSFTESGPSPRISYLSVAGNELYEGAPIVCSATSYDSGTPVSSNPVQMKFVGMYIVMYYQCGIPLELIRVHGL